MGCSGRVRRLALYLCFADALLRPVLVCRVVARHEGAHSRRLETVGSRSSCPRLMPAPAGTCGIVGAPYPAPQLWASASETPVGSLAAWPEGLMTSGGRHKHALIRPGNGTPPPN